MWDKMRINNKRYRVIAGNRGGCMNKLDEIVYGDKAFKKMQEDMQQEMEWVKLSSFGKGKCGNAIEDVAKKVAKMYDDYIFHKLIDEGCFVQVESVEEAMKRGYRVVICNAETRHEKVLSKGLNIKALVYKDAPKDTLHVVTDKELEDIMFKSLAMEKGEG